jgi:hypothetical protein
VKRLAIIALLLGLGGCAMAAPGIARATPTPQGGLQRPSTYNNQWVNKPVNPVDSLDVMMPKVEVTDISQRELGKFYIHPDVASGKYRNEVERLIDQPVQARKDEWAARMGTKKPADGANDIADKSNASKEQK